MSVKTTTHKNTVIALKIGKIFTLNSFKNAFHSCHSSNSNSSSISVMVDQDCSPAAAIVRKGGTGWIIQISPAPLTHTRSEGHWKCSGWDSGVPKPSSYLKQILVISSLLLCLPLRLRSQEQKLKIFNLWTKAKAKKKKPTPYFKNENF